MSHLVRKTALSVIGGSLLVATLGLAPAAASGSDRDGDADTSSATAYTEDTDTNDGGTPNNVADDGDNLHPSGKDRSVERGGSATQGGSESDPDDDGHGPDRSNGGPDKPNGSGGVDLADQDGNNGCGNDDDFEDDNEGWCGRKPHTAKADRTKSDADTEAASAADADAVKADDEEVCADADAMKADADDDAHVCATADAAEDSGVGAAGAMSGGAVLAAGAQVAPESAVLAAGQQAPAGAADAADDGGVLSGELPMTGISTLSFLIVAIAAMLGGFLLVGAARRSTAS